MLHEVSTISFIHSLLNGDIKTIFMFLSGSIILVHIWRIYSDQESYRIPNPNILKIYHE